MKKGFDMNSPLITFVAGLLIAGLASQGRIRLLRRKIRSYEFYIKFRIDDQMARLLAPHATRTHRVVAGGRPGSLRMATGPVAAGKSA